MAKKSTTFKGQAKPYGKSGHFHESRRHSLQARGIKTGNYSLLKQYPSGKRIYVDEQGLVGDLEVMKKQHGKKARYVKQSEFFKDTDGDGVSDKYDCEPTNPAMQDAPKTFKITDDIEIVAQWKKTPRGFKHVATLYVNGEAVDETKVNYLNRTWESYEFQSVMEKLVDKTDALTPSQKKQIKAYLEQDHTDWSGFKMVGAIAELGEVFGKTKKESNQWKERMVKAGLGDMGLQMPEDWDTLSEDEKEKRLNQVIELAKSTGENLNAPPTNKLPSGHEYELEPRYDRAKSFYEKAHVRQENGKKVLRSYNTDVAEIKDGKPVVHGTYSQTTMRHIKEFLKQNGFKAETSKQIMKDYGDE